MGKRSTRYRFMEEAYESKYVWWINDHWLPIDALETAFSGTGNITDSESGKLILKTGATINSYAKAWKIIYPTPAVFAGDGWALPTWDKARRFKALVWFYSYGLNAPTHIVMGNNAATSETNTWDHIGFKMKLDQCLYATVGDGSAETEMNIGGPYGLNFYANLEVVFTPGVEARFYLNGVDKGVITTNLPSGTSVADRMFAASIYNTSAFDKWFQVFQVRSIQEP